MTEEEKEAIEYLKYKIEDNRKMLKEYEESGNAVGYGTMTDIYKGVICNFTIILNLIENQQKEKEYWKNKYDKEIDENIVKTTKIMKQDNRIKELEKAVEKKYKIIDEMAEKIIEYKDYLEGLSDDCQRDCFLYHKVSDCNLFKDCKICVKEYFEKKERNE